jgi:signal transduction histidine kinase
MRLNSSSFYIFFLFITFLIFCCAGRIFAEHPTQSPADSLVKELKLASDTEKTHVLYALSWYLKFSHLDSARDYAQEGLDLARTLNHKKGVAKNLKSLGDIYDMKGAYSKAVQKYKEAIGIFQQLDEKKYLSYANMALGLTYFHIGDHTAALKYNQKALKIAERIDFKSNIPSCQTNIGIIHRNQGNLDRALKYHKKALKGFRETGNERNVIKAYSNLGTVYGEKHEYSRALEHFYKALKKAKELNIKPSIGIIYDNMASVHKKEKRFTRAMHYYGRSLDIFRELGYKDRMALSFGNLASLNIGMAEDSSGDKQKRYRKAIDYSLKELDLAMESGSLMRKKQAYHNLSLAYAGLKDFKEAYQYQKQYQRIKDSLFNKNKNRQIEEVETRFQMEARAQENELLKKQNQLQKTRIKRANLIRNLTIAGIVLISVFSVFFFWRYRKQRKLTQDLRVKNAYIREQTDRLDRLNQTKNQLISIISHDLRSPLTSVYSSAQVLQQGVVNDGQELKEFHRQIYKNASGVLHLLENLLSWAKSQQNEIVFQPGRQNVYPVIRQNLAMLDPMAKDKNIRLIEAVEDKDVEAVFDQNMISTVVRNLVSNAIKFTPEGGEVRVMLHNRDDQVEIAVKDTGLGVNEEDQKSIVNDKAFFSKAGTGEEKGSGIGLKVSRQFIQKHGGELQIESVPEQGSTFWFALPKNNESPPDI